MFIQSFVVYTAYSDCEECDKFKIVGVYDFIPPPAGNNIVVLLTVSEDLAGHFDPHYSDLFFVDFDGDTITNRLGPSHTLPSTTRDTIPYSLVLSTELRNQDFPTDFDGKLVIQTPTVEPCNDFECNISYSNIVTFVTKIQTDLTILVYPNPSTDFVNIETTKPIKEIKLFDINYSLVIDNGDSRNLDVSNISNGNYIIRITYIDNSSSYKAILKY
jgi:hypothetical protein